MTFALLFLLISIVGIADDPPCYKNPDLWFPPPGTLLADGHIAVQVATAPGSTGEDLIVCQGETITITVTVDNLSCGDAGPFDVSLYYDQFDEAHLIGTERLDAGLEACEYVVLEFTWNTIDVPPGFHSIIAWADVNHEVNELNEENNQYTLPVTVTVRPLAPWIEAEKIYTDENGGSPAPEDTITYEITITNDGCEDQGDNTGHEFIDQIPDFMTYVPGSASASTGTAGFEGGQVVWDGEVPMGGSVTITFQVVIAENTPNQTTICNQGVVHWDSTGDDTNDAQEPTDDPSTPQDDDPTCLTVTRPLPVIVAEKIYTDENGGAPAPGDTITYKITIRNDGQGDQENNPGYEFVDGIPDFMAYIPGSASATTGTAGVEGTQVVWDGEIPAGGSVTITFQVVIDENTLNQTIICNQGVVHWDSTGNGVNDSQEPTDDPSTQVDDDPTCLTIVRHPPAIDAEKQFIDENRGVPSPGDTITYEIEIYNHGYGRQGNNPGHEFVDSIPNFTTYIPGSVAASSGTASFEGDQVVWDGEITAGGVVTITFRVTIDEDAEDLQEICNQGIVHWASGGEGTNDVQEPTDDPATPDDDDPTCLTVGVPPAGYVISGTIDAPTLSEWGAIIFSSLFALAFFWMLFRRKRLMVRAR
jgi:uncharacterized repeat protein (TIGR01451 family)